MLRRAPRGFTLYELLVAAVISAVLVGIVYAVYIRASRAYRAQSLVVAMQQQARFALDHLRRDISLAGFNATPNSTLDPNLCTQPGSPLKAITLKRSVVAGAIPNPTDNPNIQPIEFTLFGDYTGANGELFLTESVSGNVVTLQTGFETRISEAQFAHVFDPTGGNRRYLRVVDADQYEIYLPISGVNYTARQITLTSPPPVRNGTQTCGIQGFGQGIQVSPAMFVRYRVELTNAATSTSSLVREELQTDGVTPINGSKLMIAENVVDLLAYDFVFDTDASKTSPVLVATPLPDSTILDESGQNGQLGTLSTTGQNLRFLTLKLTVRSEQEEPQLTHRARSGPHDRIFTFDVYPTLQGAARTLTLTSKVMLQTLAVRNI